MAETTVKVVVRCRPLLPHETDKDVKNVSTIDEDGGRITISGRTHDYGNESVVEAATATRRCTREPQNRSSPSFLMGTTPQY